MIIMTFFALCFKLRVAPKAQEDGDLLRRT
jgi:hypothetical protein